MPQIVHDMYVYTQYINNSWHTTETLLYCYKILNNDCMNWNWMEKLITFLQFLLTVILNLELHYWSVFIQNTLTIYMGSFITWNVKYVLVNIKK